MAQTLCTKWWHTSVNIFSKKSLFQRITSFRSIFQIYAFWVPISAVEGPHWVPISLKIRSPLGPHEKYFGSTLNVGAVQSGRLQVFCWKCILYCRLNLSGSCEQGGWEVCGKRVDEARIRQGQAPLHSHQLPLQKGDTNVGQWSKSHWLMNPSEWW